MSRKGTRGTIKPRGEWAKHMRKVYRKIFWGKERQAAKRQIHKNSND